MTAPLVRHMEYDQPAVGTTADDTGIVGVAPYAATVTSVLYVPKAARAGAATNNRTLTLYNRGAAGAGSTVVATLTLASGVDLSDNIAKTITLSTASGALTLAAGDVLEWESLHVSSGILDPGGRVDVTYARS